MSNLDKNNCIIQKRVKRDYYWQIVLSFIPDVIIALLISFFMANNGDKFSVFFISFILIQLCMLFIWLRKSVLDWVVFYYNRKRAASMMCKEFKEFKFPEPIDYIDSSLNYLENIVDNNQLKIETRLVAMKLLSFYQIFFLTNQYQVSLRSTLIMEDAIILYKKEFSNTKAIQND